MSRSYFGRAAIALTGLILPLASCVADVDVIEDQGSFDETAVLAHPDDDVAGSQIKLVEGIEGPTVEPFVTQTPGMDVSGYQGNVNWSAARSNGGRFVYVDIGKVAGQMDTPWSRRLKVPLTGITADQIGRANSRSGGALETRVPGTGKDGGPSCASVKDFAGWSAGR